MKNKKKDIQMMNKNPTKDLQIIVLIIVRISIKINQENESTPNNNFIKQTIMCHKMNKISNKNKKYSI